MRSEMPERPEMRAKRETIAGVVYPSLLELLKMSSWWEVVGERREAEAEIKYWMETPLGEAGGWDRGLGFTFRQCEILILDDLMVGL
jgi:hypothetical protein